MIKNLKDKIKYTKNIKLNKNELIVKNLSYITIKSNMDKIILGNENIIRIKDNMSEIIINGSFNNLEIINNFGQIQNNCTTNRIKIIYDKSFESQKNKEDRKIENIIKYDIEKKNNLENLELDLKEFDLKNKEKPNNLIMKKIKKKKYFIIN